MAGTDPPHPEESASRRTHDTTPVLVTAATLAFRHHDDSLLVGDGLEHMGEGDKRRPPVLGQAVDAAALPLEPAIDIVLQDLADIGNQPGGAQRADLHLAVAREELGAAQRL